MAFLGRFDWLDPVVAEYHGRHATRVCCTLDLLWDLPRAARVLEIGGYPYGMTLLMRHFLFEDLTITGYKEELLGPGSAPFVERRELRSRDGAIVYRFEEHYFECERHTWPFSDGVFDLVVAAELFEHLARDPMHAMAEANRVLRPGGRLCITVPNVLSLDNCCRMLLGDTPGILPHYRPEAVTWRHNRELTPGELRALYHAGGFEVEQLRTYNYSSPTSFDPKLLLLLRLAVSDFAERRNAIMAIGRKVDGVRERYPTAYRLYLESDIPALTSRVDPGRARSREGAGPAHDDGQDVRRTRAARPRTADSEQ